jgi:hypothetical protein
MNMTIQDVQQMALAIAKANGHPDPELYARLVVEAYVPADPAIFAPTMFVMGATHGE